MEVVIVALIVAALIGGVVLNHKNAARALEGVEFAVPQAPDAVRAVISATYCGGTKAKARAAFSRVTVAAAGPSSFRFTTKIGDAGTIEVSSDDHGRSIVCAHATELHVGGHPKLRFGRGYFRWARQSMVTCVEI